MPTQKPKCCVRDCDFRDTHEHRTKGVDNLGRSITFIVRVCCPCKDALTKKKVNCTFYRAGSLAFVEELYLQEGQDLR